MQRQSDRARRAVSSAYSDSAGASADASTVIERGARIQRAARIERGAGQSHSAVQPDASTVIDQRRRCIRTNCCQVRRRPVRWARQQSLARSRQVARQKSSSRALGRASDSPSRAGSVVRHNRLAWHCRSKVARHNRRRHSNVSRWRGMTFRFVGRADEQSRSTTAGTLQRPLAHRAADPVWQMVTALADSVWQWRLRTRRFLGAVECTSIALHSTPLNGSNVDSLMATIVSRSIDSLIAAYCQRRIL